MFEGKKFIFLTARQRIAITIVFLFLLLICLAAMYLAATKPSLSKFLVPATDIFRLALTGSAVWGLVLLYASSNSQTRINKETSRYFQGDMIQAFHANDFLQPGTGTEFGIELLRNKAGSAVFAIYYQGQRIMLFWCRLNVYEMSVVFLLPPEHAARYQDAYAVTLKGFIRANTQVDNFGVQAHTIDGVLPQKEQFLELYISRQLAPDFLFDAASRLYTANQLFGDVRSFLTETLRNQKI